MTFDWSRERKDKLVSLVTGEEKLSYADAAERLGTTRDSAYAKAKALGITGGSGRRNDNGKSKTGTARRIDPKPGRQVNPRTTKVAGPLPPEPTATRPARRDANRRPYTLETLPPDACKWPIGDPATADLHFCAHPQKPNHPYCDHHARLSAAPSQPKRPSFTPDAMAKAFGGL